MSILRRLMMKSKKDPLPDGVYIINNGVRTDFANGAAMKSWIRSNRTTLGNVICVSNDTTFKNGKELFNNCTSMTSLILNIDCTARTNFEGAFSVCTSLKTLVFLNQHLIKLTTIKCMCLHCSSLVELDMSGITNEFITDCGQAFQGMTKLTYLDLS